MARTSGGKRFTSIINIRIPKALHARLRFAARQDNRPFPDYLRVQLDRIVKDAAAGLDVTEAR